MDTDETRELLSEDEEKSSKRTRLFRSIRQSKKTAAVVMFLTFMLEVMLLTAVEPILPDILRSITLESSGELSVNTSVPGTGCHSDRANSSVPYFPVRGEHCVNPVLLGILNGVKPLMQVVLAPIIGCLVDRFGFTIPMAISFFMFFVSTLGFAYFNTYALLVGTRCVQGLGSSLLRVAGLSMLATLYQDPEERAKAMSVAYSGLAVGLIVGFPLGSFLYQFAGRQILFICMAVLILFGALICFCLMPINIQPKDKGKEEGATPGASGSCDGVSIFFDVYILVAVGIYFWVFCTAGAVMGIAPLYLQEQLGAEQWQIGVLFLVASITQCTSQYSIAWWSSKHWWWLVSMLGVLLVGISAGIFTVMGTVWLITIPFIIYGTGVGLTLGSIPPLLGHLADIRSNSQYGAVYALGTSGSNLGYFLGSTITGILVDNFSYTISFVAMSVVIILYSLVSPILWKVPEKQRSQSGSELQRGSGTVPAAVV